MAFSGELSLEEAMDLLYDKTKGRIKGKNGKVHPCTGTEALYRPYGP